MNRVELRQQAIEAAARCLEAKGYISLVDVFVDLGKLSRADYERWRLRQVPYLEKVLQSNLARINVIIRAVQENSRRGKLRASWTAYMSWGKGKRQPLRFSKSGHPDLERTYATHYLLPTNIERKHQPGLPPASEANALAPLTPLQNLQFP